jgi:hypothetical protein
MIETPQDALDFLRGLAKPRQVRDAAESGLAPARRPACNSHVHLPPNFSAFDTVEQLLDLADAQDVRVLGVSNYYDFEVYGPFVEGARRRGIFPLFGLEVIGLIDRLVRGGVKINDPGNPGKIYICGKGITGFAAPDGRAAELLEKIRRADTARMAEMIDRLAGLFAAAGIQVRLDDAAIRGQVVARHGVEARTVTLQERHVAQGFQEALFAAVPAEHRREALAKLFGEAAKSAPDDAAAVQGEIRSKLMKAGRPAFVPESFLAFEEAYELICHLGGIPCYPTLADGTGPICPFETPLDTLLENLRGLGGNGVHMAELIPIRNRPGVLAEYVTALRDAGLAVVGGTEHNTREMLGIEPTCLEGAPVGERVREIFWEGACVAAAHQFLRLHGEAGFVDAAGRPCEGFPDADARIRHFAAIGAAVIETFFRATAGEGA